MLPQECVSPNNVGGMMYVHVVRNYIKDYE